MRDDDDSSSSDFEVIHLRACSDESQQDWSQSVLLLEKCLDELYELTNGRITEVYVQSDGASNFSGTGFLLGLGLITSKITVIGHLVTEAGGGKDVTDQDFADLGKQLLNALMTGNDIITSKDIAKIANGETKKPSSSTFEVVIERSDPSQEPKTKSGIQDMYFRKLTYSVSPSSENGRRIDTLTLFNFYGIGNGVTIGSKEIQSHLTSDSPDAPLSAILKCVSKGDYSMSASLPVQVFFFILSP